VAEGTRVGRECAEIEEGSLRCVARRAEERARKGRPGHSGRDDNVSLLGCGRGEERSEKRKEVKE
jgi:hypothetical protein